MSSQWYLYKEDQLQGPFSWEELSLKSGDGTIGPDDHIWSEEIKNWTRADQIEGLFDSKGGSTVEPPPIGESATVPPPASGSPPPPPKASVGPPPLPGAAGSGPPPIPQAGMAIPPPLSSGSGPPPLDHTLAGPGVSAQTKSIYTIPILVVSAVLFITFCGAALYYIFFQDGLEVAVVEEFEEEEVTADASENDFDSDHLENGDAVDDWDDGDDPDFPGDPTPGTPAPGSNGSGDPTPGRSATVTPAPGETVPVETPPDAPAPGTGTTIPQHIIRNVRFDPHSGSILSAGTRINYSFEYTTNHSGNVQIVATPMRAGRAISNVTGKLSGEYSSGQGQGSGYFIIKDSGPVDGVRISMYPTFTQFPLLRQVDLSVNFSFDTSTGQPDDPPDPDPPDVDPPSSEPETGPRPPVAHFTISPTEPMAFQMITFNASSSYSPDGQIVNYSWRFGTPSLTINITENTTEPFFRRYFSSPGVVPVTLTVTDNHNNSGTFSFPVVISETVLD